MVTIKLIAICFHSNNNARCICYYSNMNKIKRFYTTWTIQLENYLNSAIILYA